MSTHHCKVLLRKRNCQSVLRYFVPTFVSVYGAFATVITIAYALPALKKVREGICLAELHLEQNLSVRMIRINCYMFKLPDWVLRLL